MLHEDLARLRVNEAIRTGLESQRAHRALESPADATPQDRSVGGALTSAQWSPDLHGGDWIRSLLKAAKRVAGIS